MHKKLTAAIIFIIAITISIAAESSRITINSSHTGYISSLNYFGPEKILISGGGDGVIKVWDIVKKELRNQIQISNMPVRKIAVCKTKPYAAVIVSDGINSVDLSVWNWKSGEKLFSSHMAEIPLFIEFSPAGSFVTYGKTDWNSLVFLDAESGKRQNPIPEGFGIVSSVFISNSEKTLLSYNSSGSIQYWDLKTGKIKTKIPTAANLENISYTSSGRYMTASNGREIVLIDLLKGNITDSIPAENAVISPVDESTDSIVFCTSSIDGTIFNTLSITGNSFSAAETTKIRNMDLPLALNYINGTIYSADSAGTIYKISDKDNKPVVFAENTLLQLDDFTLTDLALNATAKGKLISISTAFITEKKELDRTSDSEDLLFETNPEASYGVSNGRGNDILLWEKAFSGGGSIQIIDPDGNIQKLTDIKAPLISAEYMNDKILTLDTEGECRIIDYNSGEDIFSYSSYGLRTIDFIEGNNIIAGRNSSSSLSSPLLHINTATGETVPLDDSDILIFDLEYDELSRKLYTLGFENRNGVMRTVLKQHSGRNHDRTTTLLAYSGEDINSAFVADQNSTKVFTSIGHSGVKMLFWGGFTSLEKTSSIPEALKLNGELIAALNQDCSITIFKQSSGKKIMDIYIFKDLAWAALTDENKYYCSKDAEKYIVKR